MPDQDKRHKASDRDGALETAVMGVAFAEAARDAVRAAWASGVPVSRLDDAGQVVWVYPTGEVSVEFRTFVATNETRSVA